MTDSFRDIGRAIRRLKSRLEELQSRNNPDAEVSVAAAASEDIDLEDSVTTTERTGSATAAKYDDTTYGYGFGEYK